MILYHYSVDSYRGGDRLFNDDKRQARFSEPFRLAFEKSETVFWSVYYSAYNTAVGIMEAAQDLTYVVRCAEDYFSARRSRQPLIEILGDGENRVLRELPLPGC